MCVNIACCDNTGRVCSPAIACGDADGCYDRTAHLHIHLEQDSMGAAIFSYQDSRKDEQQSANTVIFSSYSRVAHGLELVMQPQKNTNIQ